MDPNTQKEQFSNAYLRAVAAAAGFGVYKPEVDDDSVDWVIAARGGGGTTRSPKLELQLKCTSSHDFSNDHMAFPLKIKNYNDLRHDDYQVPRILVVVLVPELVSDWLEQTQESLVMRRCGYWKTLRGEPETSNEDTITVRVPRNNILSVDGLKQLMARVGNGGCP